MSSAAGLWPRRDGNGITTGRKRDHEGSLVIARLRGRKLNYRTALRANYLSFRRFPGTPRNPLKSSPPFRTYFSYLLTRTALGCAPRALRD